MKVGKKRKEKRAVRLFGNSFGFLGFAKGKMVVGSKVHASEQYEVPRVNSLFSLGSHKSHVEMSNLRRFPGFLFSLCYLGLS